MSSENFYNIRMHASSSGRHVSGAERIVPDQKIAGIVDELIQRARRKSDQPDRITVTIENLGSAPPRRLEALDVITIDAPDVPSARNSAAKVLCSSGIAEKAVDRAIGFLSSGAAPEGGNMRGAMIMNAQTGERLEPDQTRGVRASRFDWDEESGGRIRLQLQKQGLVHYRIPEALALATKIANGKAVLAELCWSDDPDYTAGYVASLRSGYVRFPFLKQRDDARGGRVIFVDPACFDLPDLVRYLEKEAVLIVKTGIIAFRPAK